jgi:hypothetical protein
MAFVIVGETLQDLFFVMAGLVPAIHVFASQRKRRGSPGHLARRRRFAPFAR